MIDFAFKILKKSKTSRARRGIITTPHGIIETPAFVPVGTQASVKALSPEELKNLGVGLIFANTYHLFLRPGEKTIKKLGGLHQFMNWQGPIITDSGGFQVFSLGTGLEQGVGKIASIFPEEHEKNKRLKIKYKKHILKIKKEGFKSKIKIVEEGAEFQSYVDGKKILFTPEKSIQIQKDLGADLILAFDECTSPLDSYQYTKKAMERTHRWAKRSLKAFDSKPAARDSRQKMYGIIQGGSYKDLREKSAQFISNLDFFGLAIGGSLGKSKKEMWQIIDWIIPLLPENKQRHLLGIGEPKDILEGIKRGIDTFDCALPTRIARNGNFLIKTGRLNIFNACFKKDPRPIEKNCQCYACQNFSRAYLRHLFWAGEMLGPRLATIHNVFFMIDLVKKIRESI